MDGKKKHTKVTEQLFETVKLLTKGGATIAQCVTATGVCNATVTYIRRAETFEDYKDIVLKCSGGHKQKLKREADLKALEEAKPEPPKEEPTKPVEHHQTITLIANQYLAEEIKKQTELLSLINNKLTLIAEDLGCFRDERTSSNG